jgi:hypothetical protein
MIMSIPVINKVKILAQISPHLPPLNGIASPSQEVRGSVVAIEGMDATTVFSMTNSLAEELERDGKFAVRIFGGPDPYALRDAYGRVNKRLSIAETLSVIGEWHKISEEMKRFISTKPSPTSDTAVGGSSRTKSVAIAEQPSLSESQKTPDRQPSEDIIVVEDDPQGEQITKSVLSPGTLSKTADIKLATPPSQRPHFGDRTPSTSAFPSIRNSSSGDETPYTRIPAAAMQARPGTPPHSTRSTTTTDKPKQFDTAPPPRSASISSQPTVPLTAVAATPSTPTAGTANKIIPQPPPSPGLSTGTPIPIALVPHYQLTTVDSAAIDLPINDSYSPLAHWQWLATLWRGCVGPDVTIVIKGPNSAGGMSEATAAAGEGEGSTKGSVGGATDGAGSAPNSGKESVGTEQPKEGMTPETSSRTGSSVVTTSGGSEKAAAASNTPCAGPPSGEAFASGRGGDRESRQPQSQPGVDVKLLECRAVVVRMNGFGGLGSKDGLCLSGTAEDRQNAQFWETAKRRVGFEVGEFLRR